MFWGCYSVRPVDLVGPDTRCTQEDPCMCAAQAPQRLYHCRARQRGLTMCAVQTMLFTVCEELFFAFCCFYFDTRRLEGVRKRVSPRNLRCRHMPNSGNLVCRSQNELFRSTHSLTVCKLAV